MSQSPAILIVEDDASQAKMIKLLVEKANSGCTIVEARDRRSAVEALGQHNIVAVITDNDFPDHHNAATTYVVPEGGTMLTKHIRNTKGNIPVLIISAGFEAENFDTWAMKYFAAIPGVTYTRSNDSFTILDEHTFAAAKQPTLKKAVADFIADKVLPTLDSASLEGRSR